MHKMKLSPLKTRLGNGTRHVFPYDSGDLYVDDVSGKGFQRLAIGVGLPTVVNTAQITMFPKSNPIWGLVISGGLSALAVGAGYWTIGLSGVLQSVVLYWMRTEQQNKISFSNPSGQGVFQP